MTERSDSAGGRYVVLLDRVVPDREPAYPIAGRGTCVTCAHWVWLKPDTDDRAVPKCVECGVRSG